MIDHVGLTVKDFERSRDFYEKALAPLGYRLMVQIGENAAGFGIGKDDDFWIRQGEPTGSPVHVAFRSSDRKTVQKFYSSSLEAGGRDNGKPGLRPQYHINYYGAFVFDPDGTTLKRCVTSRNRRSHDYPR